MNVMTNKTATLLTAGLLMGMAGLTHATLLDVTFGTANDNFGGFTSGASATTTTPAPAWALTATGARFTNDPTGPASPPDSGQVNSSFLRQVTLDRSDGASYTITGVLDLISTYAGDNNRLGMSIFATSEALAGVDSGISLQVNLGSGQVQIRHPGVNGVSTFATASLSGILASDLIGQRLVYTADIDFVGANINLAFSLAAPNLIPDPVNDPLTSFSQSISSTGTIVADSFTGDNFGFGNRGRVRNENPGFIFEAQSFAVIPEPSTLVLLGIALGSVVLLRRRK